MNPLVRLIHEVHRRSLWQVTGIFLAASWVVLQVVEVLTETAGLPDWTPTMALVLLLLGLPMCLATAFVQEGMPGQGGGDAGVAGRGAVDDRSGPAEVAAANLSPGTGALDLPSTRPTASRRLFNWRNAILGGVAAFALLGVTVVAYFLMWSAGIGPVGSLVAQGVLEDGDRVVLADFDDTTGEGLGRVVTEALRVDLSTGSILRPFDAADVVPVLARMGVEPGTPLGGELAREVAVREGIKAFVDGDVAAAGTGYLITASLRATETGRAIASFRVTARGPDEVIPSIDKLSQDLREKSGEPLRSIKAGEPLERVSTRSLEALRLYSDADGAFDRGDDQRALELLTEATRVDPEFAMAWRKLAVVYGNTGIDFAKQVEAATRAYEHRARLTEKERYLAEAYYAGNVEVDEARVIAAYQNVLRIDPDDGRALNNLALRFQARGEFERSLELLERAVGGPGRSNTAYRNLIGSYVALRRFDDAEAALAGYEAAYASDIELPAFRFYVALARGDVSRALAAVEGVADDGSRTAFSRAENFDRLSDAAYWQGRLGEGRSTMLRAAALASSVTPGYAWIRRLMTALREQIAGDAAWAHAHLATAIDDGTFDALPATERFHVLVAVVLSMAGDVERTERVLTDWSASVPAQRRAPGDLAFVAAAAAVGRATAGAPADEALADFDAAVASTECHERCWTWLRGAIFEAVGDPGSAIDAYEAYLQRGESLVFLNAAFRLHALLRLGPLYEQVGDSARAVEAYQRIVEQWGNADSGGLQVVRRFQGRIDALASGS